MFHGCKYHPGFQQEFHDRIVYLFSASLLCLTFVLQSRPSAPEGLILPIAFVLCSNGRRSQLISEMQAGFKRDHVTYSSFSFLVYHLHMFLSSY